MGSIGKEVKEVKASAGATSCEGPLSNSLGFRCKRRGTG